MTNVSMIWSSANPARATVDSQGMVTGLGLGTADITARAGNTQSQLRITVLPLRIQIRPEGPLTAQVRDTIQFEATALDVNEKPLAEQPSQWNVFGANGGQINAATINNRGQFAALGVSRVTVRALFQIPGGGTVPQVWETAEINIVPKLDYRVKRVLSSGDVRHSLQLQPVPVGSMAVNDAGQVAVVGLLDGIAGGLLYLDKGQISLLAAGGNAGPVVNAGQFGSVMDTPSPPAINRRGDVLSAISLNPGTQVLSLCNATGCKYPLVGGMNVGAAERIGGFGIRWGSLNDAGEIVFSTGFTQAGTTIPDNGLIRYTGGFADLVVSASDTLEGLSSPLRFTDWAIDNQGIVWFVAASNSDPSRQALYRREGFDRPVRVIGPGDRIGENRVSSVVNVVVLSNGVAYGAILEGGSATLVRMSGGQTSRVIMAGSPWLYSGSGPRGLLFWGNPSGPWGVHRWNGTSISPVFMQGQLAPNGQPLTQVDVAYETAAGEVIVQGRTPDNQLVIFRAGSSTAMLSGGDVLPLTAGPQFRFPAQLSVAGPSSVYLMLGGPASLFEADGISVTPKLIAGSRLPDETFASLNQAFSSGNDFYFQSGGIYKLTSAGIERLVPNNFTSGDGVNLSAPRLLAVSDAGSVLFNSSARLFVYEDGRIREVPRGSLPTAFSFNQIQTSAVDTRGRIFARFQNPADPFGSGPLYLFENGAWKPCAVPRETRVGAYVIDRVFSVRARGDRVYAVFQYLGNDSSMVEYGDDGWSHVIEYGITTPEGGVNIGVINNYDLNSRNDIAFVSTGNGFSSLIARVGGQLRQIYSHTYGDGSILPLASIMELRLLENGVVYFIAMDEEGLMGLYVAEPLF
jgi:hypothetical protein